MSSACHCFPDSVWQQHEQSSALVSRTRLFCPARLPAAVEEYAEAVAFRCYLTDGRLIKQAEVELAEVEECEWG